MKMYTSKATIDSEKLPFSGRSIQTQQLNNAQSTDRNKNASYHHKYQALEIDSEAAMSVVGAVELEDISTHKHQQLRRYATLLLALGVIAAIGALLITSSSSGSDTSLPVQGGAWSSRSAPFSVVNPVDLGVLGVDRPLGSKPGPVLSNFFGLEKPDTPLPTNAWFENLILGDTTDGVENKVFEVPYVLDTAGLVPGVRTHACHVKAASRAIEMTYEVQNGVVIGAAEKFQKQHRVYKHRQEPVTISKLGIELEWVSDKYEQKGFGPTMRAPIVRGAPYTSMKYIQATPLIVIQRVVRMPIIIDPINSFATATDGSDRPVLLCTNNTNAKPFKPVLVNRELKIQVDQADTTWHIFVSEPTEFTCVNRVAPPAVFTVPGVVTVEDPATAAYFELRASKPMQLGMVRIAMSNNCTSGQNPEYCTGWMPRDNTGYEDLLRAHADLYPTAKADIEFTFPVDSAQEEELRLTFNWRPRSMKELAMDPENFPSSDKTSGTSSSTNPTTGAATYDDDDDGDNSSGGSDGGQYVPPYIPPGDNRHRTSHSELLMFAMPHHQERMRAVPESSNAVVTEGCLPTIHGLACPALGESWSLVEHLHYTSFYAEDPIKDELKGAIQSALQHDIHYQLPQNYMRGAGDTYFSGKMLAKLARILLVAEQVGGVKETDFNNGIARLRSGVEIWLNGSAESPMLYDRSWGGIVMCGCNYVSEQDAPSGTGHCANKFPDCPALTDQGQNFGAGYYNDHHFHFGYHIYAAAVVSHFDHDWARKFHQHVLLLVRDIVNPSDDDPYFPTWRHKDWYLGYSWASGIVTIGGKPYPNGRNEESSSESIAAYEAVAMYGEAMAAVFEGSPVESDRTLLEACSRIKDMGRLLMATEIRSAITYWHVQAPGTKDVYRIYPDVYESKIVGMIWSMLAQEQTWFGNEQWKSYGIQLMPITPASGLRDNVGWVAEMLPFYRKYCNEDPVCRNSGWNVLSYTCLAEVGQWRKAAKGLQQLDLSYFEDAGGNGHSLSNSLWYVATRPDPGIEYRHGGSEESGDYYGDDYFTGDDDDVPLDLGDNTGTGLAHGSSAAAIDDVDVDDAKEALKEAAEAAKEAAKEAAEEAKEAAKELAEQTAEAAEEAKEAAKEAAEEAAESAEELAEEAVEAAEEALEAAKEALIAAANASEHSCDCCNGSCSGHAVNQHHRYAVYIRAD